MKKNLAVMTAVLMMAALAGCGGNEAAETTAAPAAEGTAEAEAAETEAEETEASDSARGVRRGEDPPSPWDLTADLPPMGFMDDDGSYVGFDLDLAREVADRMGLEFVAQPILWDAKDMELDNGTIDCVWNGFTITGREDQYTWTEPYMNNEQVLWFWQIPASPTPPAWLARWWRCRWIRRRRPL